MMQCVIFKESEALNPFSVMEYYSAEVERTFSERPAERQKLGPRELDSGVDLQLASIALCNHSLYPW
jgi:hypothetical protein